jgi:hypothetical protein
MDFADLPISLEEKELIVTNVLEEALATKDSLQRVFMYLWERHKSAPLESVSQSEIFLDVFGIEKADADQSRPRTYVHRLRETLEAYFSHAGARHPLRVEIPDRKPDSDDKGYRLLFSRHRLRDHPIEWFWEPHIREGLSNLFGIIPRMEMPPPAHYWEDYCLLQAFSLFDRTLAQFGEELSVLPWRWLVDEQVRDDCFTKNLILLAYENSIPSLFGGADWKAPFDGHRILYWLAIERLKLTMFRLPNAVIAVSNSSREAAKQPLTLQEGTSKLVLFTRHQCRHGNYISVLQLADILALIPVIDLITSELGLNYLAAQPEFSNKDRNSQIPPCIQVLFSVGPSDQKHIFKSNYEHVAILDCVINR